MASPEAKLSLHDEADAVYRHAEKVVSAEELEQCYRRMADEISAQLAGQNPVIVCVMLGGMVPSVRIMECLDFGFELDYLHATRYGSAISGSTLAWKVSPRTDLTDRHVLVLDDIVDEGHTLAEIQGALRAQRPASLTTAALLNKQHARRVDDVSVEIVGANVPDRYVFGGGMDYRGYFRQLRAIWAMAEDAS
ncbi:hypoxanthine-guanine phosphoribosyltransferase [Salinisphaera sp. USBA-960]|uniref:hypoxanthine-guanine phosphoribosyltransferase n=1 Tax=Salinisphaera orenii TaxID=856731 RepID=UPI000DBEA51E|nr:hypoxanthine-guanine phosphoribosyltransferase [Salifodinibacter halophilus]NNC25889.1 hypoxanthine-guanine phosphoribosyltransferase [Salifodinibacter halophilus]